MKAPEWMHDWLAKLTGPGWKWHAEKSASVERNKRIKEMLSKERVLKELAEADRESNITLPPGDVKQITDTGRSIKG